jgi:hypothetical protein
MTDTEEQPLRDFLDLVATRDRNSLGDVEPSKEVQERLGGELEKKSGCVCTTLSLDERDAELTSPARFSVAADYSQFASTLLSALDLAAENLRSLSPKPKRFELVLTGDFNRTRQGAVQFRVALSFS